MLESIVESELLLIDMEGYLQQADRLLVNSRESLEIMKGLVFKSYINLNESINLLQKTNKADGHYGKTIEQRESGTY